MRALDLQHKEGAGRGAGGLQACARGPSCLFLLALRIAASVAAAAVAAASNYVSCMLWVSHTSAQLC